MNPQTLGLFHVAACAAALLLGAAVAAAPKGTRWHRRTGRVFLACMLVLNASALGLYELTGHFNGFHLMALVSLVGMGVGWWLARRSRRSELAREVHGRLMLWTYAGVLAAAASELVVRLPFVPRGSGFVTAVVGASLTVGVVAAVLIERAMRRGTPNTG